MKAVSAFIIFTLIFFQSALAELEKPESHKQAREISSQIFSPFCPGRTLADCPSSAATDLRNKIEERINAGESKSQVMQYLVSLYGDQISALPPSTGFGMLAWLAPIAFLLAGVFMVFLWVRKQQKMAQPVRQIKLDQKIADRVEREIDF